MHLFYLRQTYHCSPRVFVDHRSSHFPSLSCSSACLQFRALSKVHQTCALQIQKKCALKARCDLKRKMPDVVVYVQYVCVVRSCLGVRCSYGTLFLYFCFILFLDFTCMPRAPSQSGGVPTEEAGGSSSPSRAPTPLSMASPTLYTPRLLFTNLASSFVKVTLTNVYRNWLRPKFASFCQLHTHQSFLPSNPGGTAYVCTNYVCTDSLSDLVTNSNISIPGCISHNPSSLVDEGQTGVFCY